MKRFALFVSLLFLYVIVNSQEKMDYFLPVDVNYNPDIPTPEQFFNQEMGEWHLTHDQILSYLHEIDRLSDRAVIQEYARSYENRPLIHMIFTSENNLKNLEQLKKLHNEFSEPGSEIVDKDVPLVVNLGYSVHGNESSAANSSVLTVYYLAAAQGKKIDKLLNNTIILVDPCLNPDGFTRHSTWANMHQSSVDMSNSGSRQFSEVWPGGRTNHYWFDLNRDYILLVHPESRGRVEKFHEWKPNVVTDHHEMGNTSSFFFQPGVPSRNNPLTPEKNFELTAEIAKYHAHFLDSIGSYYFSEENFDDYYIGKGSSYPDINGSIGILFEQAGFRGRIRETPSGNKKFAFAIRNQFNATLSTLASATNLKNDLLNMQKDFYKDALIQADKDPVKAYLFGDEQDREKTLKLAGFLKRHQIQVYPLIKQFSTDGIDYTPENSFAVRLKQKQYRLIKSFFETVTSFSDTTFYDVSTWTIPLAFDIPYASAGTKELAFISEQPIENLLEKSGEITGGISFYAYVFDWNEYSAPEAMYSLLNEGIYTKVASNKFTCNVKGQNKKFSYGAVLIPVAEQKLTEDKVYKIISEVAYQTGIDFYPVQSGLTQEGIDFGSNDFYKINKPEILMLVGKGVNSREAGELWHLFDIKYKIPVCLVDVNDLNVNILSEFNTVILPSGSYQTFNESDKEAIKAWVQKGNTLITFGEAARFSSSLGLGNVKFKPAADRDSTASGKFADSQSERAKNLIAGAIFNAEMDITHPLCYGYYRNNIAVFKTGTTVAESLKKPYAEPVQFTESPLLSGYASKQNIERIKGSPVVSINNTGRGTAICFYEDMNFRGYWLGTNKMIMNAVFFSGLM
ncbi:MAG: zinc carboxypeptidase [Prolixibacteraceae bacterium]|nr:zinc carboxypeptidase [Prolixibacteraceae bacterium]